MASTALSRKAQRALKKAQKTDYTKNKRQQPPQIETHKVSQPHFSSFTTNPSSATIQDSPIHLTLTKAASPILSVTMEKAWIIGGHDLQCVHRNAEREPLWDDDEEFNPLCTPLPSYKPNWVALGRPRSEPILSPLYILSDSSVFRPCYYQESSLIPECNGIRRPEQNIHFQVLECRGEGYFGKVVSARQKHDGRIVCIKICNMREHQMDVYVEGIRNESEVRSRLRAGSFSPFVLETFAHWTSPLDGSFYLVMPFMCGDLHKLLDHPITVLQLQTYVLQILSGISHLHDRGIIHRDIKPSNILLVPNHFRLSIDVPYNITITDFGLSYIHPIGETTPSPFSPSQQFDKGGDRFVVPLTNISAGTADFMAPELYNIQVDRDGWAGFGAPDNSWIRSVVHDLTTDDVAGYDHTVDYWALGVTMYQLMTGRLPFEGPDYATLHASLIKYCQDSLILTGQYWANTEDQFPEDVAEVLTLLLHPSPVRRLQCRKLANLAFFKCIGEIDPGWEEKWKHAAYLNRIKNETRMQKTYTEYFP